MLRTIFILLIRLFRILFFLLLCLINSFFGTFEKTQLQIEHFLEHLAKWHCLERNFLFCVCTNTGVPLCIHLLYCHLSVVTLIFQFSPVNNPLSKNLFCSICQIVNEHCHRCIFCLLLFSTGGLALFSHQCFRSSRELSEYIFTIFSFFIHGKWHWIISPTFKSAGGNLYNIFLIIDRISFFH